jgi:hypothetical protein
MKIEKIETIEHGTLKPILIATFECVDQQEFDSQLKVLEHIQNTRLLVVVGGHLEE